MMDDASETLEVLQAENAGLRARLSILLEQAERNHEVMCRHQQFDLAIVGSSGFPDLVRTIFRVLPIISELDAVTLTLIDVDADIRTVMEKLGVDFALFPDLLFAQDADELFFPHDGAGVPTPILGRYEQAADSFGRAVALAPDFAPAHYNHGIALGALERHALRPQHDLVRGAGHGLTQASHVISAEVPFRFQRHAKRAIQRAHRALQPGMRDQ